MGLIPSKALQLSEIPSMLLCVAYSGYLVVLNVVHCHSEEHASKDHKNNQCLSSEQNGLL